MLASVNGIFGQIMPGIWEESSMTTARPSIPELTMRGPGTAERRSGRQIRFGRQSCLRGRMRSARSFFFWTGRVRRRTAGKQRRG